MQKKDAAVAFVQAVTRQDEAQVRALANEDYIQHNPFLPTGLEPFIGVFPVLAEHKTQAKQIRVFEDGNYLVIHHLWTGAAPFGAPEMVAFDILRFDEQGKIAEHWDALMPNTPPNASGRTLIDGTTEVVDAAHTAANKELVRQFMHDVMHGHNPGNITQYISQETYLQHNPQIKDGLAGLQEALQQLAAANDLFVYKQLHLLVGEGNFVLTVNEGEWHGKPHVFYDLLRVENGKLVEHWDVIQEVPSEGLANENGMFGFTQ